MSPLPHRNPWGRPHSLSTSAIPEALSTAITTDPDGIEQRKDRDPTEEPTSCEQPLFPSASPVPIATAPPIISTAQAIIRGGGWIETPLPQGEAPEYRYKDKRGSIIHNIIAQNPDSGGLEYQVGDQAWSIVNAFDTPTAFLHLAFAAYAARQTRPWAEEMQIKATDLIKNLGLSRRKDLSRAEKCRRIMAQAQLLRSLSVRMDWSFPKSTRCVIGLSPMWEIAFYIYGQRRLAGPQTASGSDNGVIPDEVVLIVRPGEWARYFLNRTGLEEGSSLFWIGYMAACVLRFDPYQEPVASKLAVLLTLTFVVQNPRRKVKSLLEYAYPVRQREAAANGNRRQCYAMKQSFDNALYTLSVAGWQISFPITSYSPALVPTWARADDSPPPSKLPRGYWSAFLNSILEVTPPGNIAERLAANRGRSSGIHKRDRPQHRKLAGEEIRSRRVACRLSQKQLGELVGKSRTWVSMIESGSRSPSHRDTERLLAVFSTNGGERP